MAGDAHGRARRAARGPRGARRAQARGRLSHGDAAGVLFAGTTALHCLREKATVGPGTTVLVNGASGAVMGVEPVSAGGPSCAAGAGAAGTALDLEDSCLRGHLVVAA